MRADGKTQNTVRLQGPHAGVSQPNQRGTVADMAAQSDDKQVVPVAEVPHDRVVGLSLRNDGTVDQNNPEIIGDKDAAKEATRKQFAEFAVSAVDAEKRREVGLAGSDEGDTSDAAIDRLKAEHDKVAKSAEKAADSLVESLHKG